MNEIRAHPASEENPGFLLWQVSTLWSKFTTAALKPLGLTHPQFVILASLDWLKGKGASQEEIERQVVLDPKTTSHLLRSLQVKKLIEPNEKKHYLLTTAGEERLAQALPVVQDVDTAFFASIDLKNSKIVPTFQTLARVNFSKLAGARESDS
jgi:DNA-binding MarR family transcriptional regulator